MAAAAPPPAALVANFPAGQHPLQNAAGGRYDVTAFTDTHWQCSFAGGMGNLLAAVAGGGLPLDVAISTIWSPTVLLEKASDLVPVWDAVAAGTPQRAFISALACGLSVGWARGPDTDTFTVRIKPSHVVLFGLPAGTDTVDVTKAQAKDMIGAAGRDGQQADFASALVLLFRLLRASFNTPLTSQNLEPYQVLAETHWPPPPTGPTPRTKKSSPGIPPRPT